MSVHAVAAGITHNVAARNKQKSVIGPLGRLLRKVEKMVDHIIKSRTLFFLAQFDEHFVDDLIWLVTSLNPANWSTPGYVHAEKWRSDCNGKFIDDRGNYLGTVLTSTLRGDNKGTVIRPAREVIKHPGHWHCCEVGHRSSYYWAAMQWAHEEVRKNRGYGFRDLPKFAGISMLSDPLRNICSEAVHNFDVKGGIFEKMGCPGPRQLARLYKEAGIKISPLKDWSN